MDKPVMVEIINVVEESDVQKTFRLDVMVDAAPGQFVMLWIPGLDEKPMSLSCLDPVEVTVKKVGPFTEKLFEMTVGDFIGFRGPYGNGFKPVPGECLVVGGGCGTAPLRPLKDLVEGDVVVSSVTSDQLLFIPEFSNSNLELYTCTDDGSEGFPGLAWEKVRELLEENTYDCVYCCGPELMMKRIADMCVEKNIPCQLSLERYMKCGIGLCGSCMVGEKRVCRDGPVFMAQELQGTEFGLFDRDECGCRRKFGDV
ncbi:MAG TPA: dihydroorotate dehydrogenase electron transfer subunit [Candidatus Altiarchaeales archaeon]|nr:dihydroorotate dehydrogenase electron transfer subunit [Candidatus Altiarchaeales archaeon]